MIGTKKTRSGEIRERLGHPVIDVDGHIVEVMPVLREHLRNIGGTKVLDKYIATLPAGHLLHDGSVERQGGPRGWYGLSREGRRERRVTRSGFWAYPTGNAVDRATVMIPNLYRKRLDELGIDYAILYPSIGFSFLRNPEDDIRIAGCRAYNAMCADLYGEHADRLTTAAIIPMNTPAEAIAELEYAVRTLGLKTVVLATCIRRPIPEVVRRAPDLAPFATWMDVLALSSDYDYDPVWKKCIELKVAATSHTTLVGWGPRAMPDNFVYNHIGHFAQAGEAFCKALVIGGVASRFPDLNFAFLEGGVGWAASLYNDLIEHWEKRNIAALHENLDPAKLDRELIAKLFVEYGGKIAQSGVDSLANNPAAENPADLDEFSALPISDARQFKEIFSNFYFGCEPDDRMTTIAFNPRINHFDTTLNAMFSSDVGHFDTPDITAVVGEAYELVEDGLLSEASFRDFTFTNAVRLHAGMNPGFFDGTPLAEAARTALAD